MDKQQRRKKQTKAVPDSTKELAQVSARIEALEKRAAVAEQALIRLRDIDVPDIREAISIHGEALSARTLKLTRGLDTMRTKLGDSFALMRGLIEKCDRTSAEPVGVVVGLDPVTRTITVQMATDEGLREHQIGDVFRSIPVGKVTISRIPLGDEVEPAERAVAETTPDTATESSRPAQPSIEVVRDDGGAPKGTIRFFCGDRSAFAALLENGSGLLMLRGVGEGESDIPIPVRCTVLHSSFPHCLIRPDAAYFGHVNHFKRFEVWAAS